MMEFVDNTVVLFKPDTFEYPISLEQFRQDNKHVLFGETCPVALIELNGYKVVHTIDKPNDDVVTELPPIEQDGEYYQQWASRSYNEQELAQQLQAAKSTAQYYAKEAFEWTRERGAPYTFPDNSVQHIQLREVDITNLTGLGLKGDRQPDRNYFFRSYENTVNQLTGAQVHDLTNTAFEKFELLLREYWTIQGEIEAAQSQEALLTKEVIRQRINNSVE